MVSIDHVAQKIVTYFPYVLVLVDIRFQGKTLYQVYVYSK